MRTLCFALVLSLAACASDPDSVPPGTEAGTVDPVAASAPVDTAEAPSTATASADAVVPAAGSPVPTELADWIDEPAVRPDGLRFVSDAAVRPQLAEAFGVEPGLLERLEGDAAAYDASRVTFHEGMVAVAYRPTRSNTDPRPLYLLVDVATGSVHAILTDGGDTFYRRSYMATAGDLTPEAVAWMQAQSGVDVAEQARLGDEEIPSP